MQDLGVKPRCSTQVLPQKQDAQPAEPLRPGTRVHGHLDQGEAEQIFQARLKETTSFKEQADRVIAAVVNAGKKTGPRQRNPRNSASNVTADGDSDNDEAIIKCGRCKKYGHSKAKCHRPTAKAVAADRDGNDAASDSSGATATVNAFQSVQLHDEAWVSEDRKSVV